VTAGAPRAVRRHGHQGLLYGALDSRRCSWGLFGTELDSVAPGRKLPVGEQVSVPRTASGPAPGRVCVARTGWFNPGLGFESLACLIATRGRGMQPEGVIWPERADLATEAKSGCLSTLYVRRSAADPELDYAVFEYLCNRQERGAYDH
jgi:hypothetical protein